MHGESSASPQAPSGWPWSPPPLDLVAPVPPAPRRRTVAAAALCGAAVAVLGAPLGLLWVYLAPEVPLVMTEGGAVLAQSQPEQFVAADGWFTLLGVGFGVLAAFGVWRVGRAWRGPVGLVAVTVGAVAAALLAWWLGRQIGLAEYLAWRDTAEVGSTFGRPPDLRIADAGWWPPMISGVPLVPALFAAVTYTLIAAWSRFPSLRPYQPTVPDDPWSQ